MFMSARNGCGGHVEVSGEGVVAWHASENVCRRSILTGTVLLNKAVLRRAPCVG